MKWIMILVTLPGTWQPGREHHAPFDTLAECREALAHVRWSPETEGWGYCATRENEVWYYKEKAPGYRTPLQ